MLSCIHWGAMPCLPQLLRGNTSNSCDIRLEGHHSPKRLFWMGTVSNLTSLQYHQHLKTRLQTDWLRTDISSCPFEQKLKSYTSFYFSVFLHTIFVSAFAPSCLKYFKNWENVFSTISGFICNFQETERLLAIVPIQCVNNIWSKQEYK